MIREATVTDAPDVAALWQCWAQQQGYGNPDVHGWFEQEARGIEAGTILCIVAYEGGDMVGFADGSLAYEPGTRKTTLVGRHLFVLPEVRGQALGDRLMVRLLALGRQSGASCLVTHGTPTMRAVEKYLGMPMKDHATLRIARW